MSTIPKIVHLTSKTFPLSAAEMLVVEKNKRIMRNWTFQFWDDAMNLNLISQEFSHLRSKYTSLPRGVMKADIARLAYLHTFGGWYLDTDYLLLRSLDEFKYIQGKAILPKNRFKSFGKFSLGNAVLGSPKGAKIWSQLIHGILESNHLIGGNNKDIIENTGPLAISRIVKEQIDPETYIAPNRLYFHSSKKAPLPRKAFGIHLCFGSWRSVE